MKKLLWTVGLAALAFWFLKRLRLEGNDLIDHLEAQGELQKLGKVATLFGQESLSQYPLSAIGDTPYAGISIDPFFPEAFTSAPKRIDFDMWNPESTNTQSKTNKIILQGGGFY